MQQKICIGEILKPQGILGAVKVRPITDDSSRFLSLKNVYVDTQLTPIEQASLLGEFVVLKLSGVINRDTAETLRGKLLYVERSDAVDTGDGYFIVDLIGASVLDEAGAKLGVIDDILSHGAADVVECRSNNGTSFRFPFLDHVVKNVDVLAKEFVVIKDLWQQVVVYDD